MVRNQALHSPRFHCSLCECECVCVLRGRGIKYVCVWVAGGGEVAKKKGKGGRMNKLRQPFPNKTRIAELLLRQCFHCKADKHVHHGVTIEG